MLRRNAKLSSIFFRTRNLSSLAHIKGETSFPLINETFGQAFEKSAEKFNSSPFTVYSHQNITLSWTETLYRADRVAQSLLRLGYKPGDRFGVFMANYWEWTVTQIATARIGVILVNLNPSYGSKELGQALNLVQCKGMLFSTVDERHNFQKIVEECFPSFTDNSKMPYFKNLITKEKSVTPGIFSFEDLLSPPPKANTDISHYGQQLDCQDLINIQYTSGTTGLPKAAALSHHNILNNALFTGRRIELRENDKLCVQVPLYHCFGTVLGNLVAILHGACLVFPSPWFDAQESLNSIKKEKCTHIYGVPTMLLSMLSIPNAGSYCDSVRGGIMAGSACAPDLMKQVMNELNMKEVTIGYGMTETSPISFQTRIDDSIDNRCETLGVIHPHVECKVINKEGKTVKRNEVGELLTKGYLVMKGGYFNQIEATQDSIDNEQFMHTGDLVTIDDAGYARLVGRSKDIIIRGGENIAPLEIEATLFSMEEIGDISVVAVPDRKYGEQVCACVILAPDCEPLDQAELRNRMKLFSEGKMSHFKVPQYIVFMEDFPKTVTGKIQKNVLRIHALEKLKHLLK